MKEINILYTANHEYVKPMLVSMYSLLENNKNLNITIHIMHDNFNTNDFKIIENIISEFENCNVYFYDFKIIENIINEYNIPDWRGTKIANARVFFNEYIKNIDNLLYLDSDTIVVDNLNSLKNYSDTIHMVKDSMPTTHWKNLAVDLEKYCNSGVLWINVSKWKNNNCDKKIINLLESDITYTYPDQDILNMALKDDIMLLPPEYNLFSTDAYFNTYFLYKFYKKHNIERYSSKELQKAKNNPVILHATPFYFWRAWEDNEIHPYNEIYDYYLYKIYGEVKKEEGVISPNPLSFKLNLYSNLILPEKPKQIIKKILK